MINENMLGITYIYLLLSLAYFCSDLICFQSNTEGDDLTVPIITYMMK